MIRRTFIIFIFAFISFLVFLPPNALAETNRIYDDANLLADDEVQTLESKADHYSHKRKTDFLIVTITEAVAEDIETYLKELVDDQNLGYDDEDKSAVILGVDIDRRDVVIHGFGKAEERLDASRLDLILDEITPELSEANYFGAFTEYIDLSSDYIRYKPGANPRNILYKTWGQLLAAVLFASFVVGLMLKHTNPKVTTTAATYRDESRTKINRKRDRYLRKSVSRRAKPKKTMRSSNRQGRSRTRIGGGRTPGGRTFSRSRRKF